MFNIYCRNAAAAYNNAIRHAARVNAVVVCVISATPRPVHDIFYRQFHNTVDIACRQTARTEERNKQTSLIDIVAALLT